VRARRASCAVIAGVLAGVAGCTAGTPQRAAPPADGTIRFVAYDFSENQVLVEVYAEAVRRAGLPVTVDQAGATREVVEPALEQGVVDVVIDYLGTVTQFVLRQEVRGREPEEVHAALDEALGPREVTVLEPAPAEDQNGFAVSSKFAAEHHVGRLSELAPFASDLVFGGPPECPDRPLCLPGLEEVYGIRFKEVRSMPSRAATVEALQVGEIDVGLLETTDARRFTAPIILLIDDRELQPHENVVPLVRTAVLDRWGDRLRTALDETSARLTAQEVVALNRAVDIDDLTPQEAAKEWWNRQ
jgi:osmoprotectant transport system substrate-binding protein